MKKRKKKSSKGLKLALDNQMRELPWVEENNNYKRIRDINLQKDVTPYWCHDKRNENKEKLNSTNDYLSQIGKFDNLLKIYTDGSVNSIPELQNQNHT